MRIDIITLFPGLFDSFLAESLIHKALTKDLFEIRLVDIRDFCRDKHKTADDRPFGGGHVVPTILYSSLSTKNK